MPRPWSKKSRVSRISQLVADLQSPKNGSPLVVQTGFPTSLIDLFVKNRDRMKKSSSRRKTLIETEDEIRMTNHAQLVSSPEPTGDGVDERENLAQPSNEIELVSENQKKDGDFGDGFAANNDFLSVFKLFVAVMVVLGLSIKYLAIGITMSAFLLLFLEYIGRRLENSYDRKSGFWSLIGKVYFPLKALVLKRVEFGGNISADKNHVLRSSGPSEEIQIAESDHCDLIEEIQVVENCSQKGDCVEEHQPTIKEFLELGDDGAELCKDKHKKASKLIRKFFSKKLQNKKKEQRNKGKEMEIQKEESCRIEGETCLSRHNSIEKRQIREQEEVNTRAHSCRESSKKEAEMEGTRKKNSGYLILLLIVLAGLLGGRMLAFLITIAWCVMLKFVGNLRKSANPTMRFSMQSSR